MNISRRFTRDTRPEQLLEQFSEVWHVAKLNEIHGTAVDETVTGTSLPEYMCGYEGTDTIIGNSGADYIDACHGNDTLYGGRGRDVFFFYSVSAHDVIADWGRGDIMALGFPGAGLSDIHIERGARGNECVVTVEGFAEFSVTVLGRGFDMGDVLLNVGPIGGW